MFKMLFRDKEIEVYVLIYAMVLMEYGIIVVLKLLFSDSPDRPAILSFESLNFSLYSARSAFV